MSILLPTILLKYHPNLAQIEKIDASMYNTEIPKIDGIFMSFSFKNFKKPTPYIIRHTADSVLAALGSAGALSIFEQWPKLAMVCWTVGFLCKFLSNFFCDDGPSSQK